MNWNYNFQQSQLDRQMRSDMMHAQVMTQANAIAEQHIAVSHSQRMVEQEANRQAEENRKRDEEIKALKEQVAKLTAEKDKNEK